MVNKMATVTTVKDCVDYVNASMKELGWTDGTTITADNFDTINALPAEQKSELLKMIVLLNRQRVFRMAFDSSKNKFRKFYVDLMGSGWTIQDIFVNILDGVTPLWDNPNATPEQIAADLVKYKETELNKKYHYSSIKKVFPTSVDERTYNKVFTSAQFPRIIDMILTNDAVSAEYWLLKEFVSEIKTMVDGQDIIYHTNHSLNNTQSIKNFVEDLRATMGGINEPDTKYNKDGVVTRVDKDDLFIVTTPEILERIKVQDLSGLFNLDKGNIPDGNIITVPNGTDLGTDPTSNKKALMVLLSDKSVVMGIKTWDKRAFPVPNTMTLNTWLHIEGIKSHNTFMPAVAFCGDFSEFNNIEVIAEGN